MTNGLLSKIVSTIMGSISRLVERGFASSATPVAVSADRCNKRRISCYNNQDRIDPDYTGGGMARPSYVAVDGYESVDQGGYFRFKSKGTQKKKCDLDTLFNFWTPQNSSFVGIKNTMQLPQGMKLCLCCGEVRPRDRFDVDVSLGHGLARLLLAYCDMLRSQRSTWLSCLLLQMYHRRVLKGRVVLNSWCRQCVDEIAPTFKATEVCSKCGQEKPRAEFSPDPDRRNGLRSKCKVCEAVVSGDYRRRKAEAEGRTLRAYEYHIYTNDGLLKVA